MSPSCKLHRWAQKVAITYSNKIWSSKSLCYKIHVRCESFQFVKVWKYLNIQPCKSMNLTLETRMLELTHFITWETFYAFNIKVNLKLNYSIFKHSKRSSMRKRFLMHIFLIIANKYKLTSILWFFNELPEISVFMQISIAEVKLHLKMEM